MHQDPSSSQIAARVVEQFNQLPQWAPSGGTRVREAAPWEDLKSSYLSLFRLVKSCLPSSALTWKGCTQGPFQHPSPQLPAREGGDVSPLLSCYV